VADVLLAERDRLPKDLTPSTFYREADAVTARDSALWSLDSFQLRVLRA